jgi:hypothetical protein
MNFQALRGRELMDGNDRPANSEIIRSPEHYFSSQSQSLEQRIDSVKLSEAEEVSIATKQTKKVIRDKALGLFKIGEIINVLLNWNNAIDKEIREAKKEYLLANYLERADRGEYAVASIKNFLTNPQGNTLFNKILRIFDDSPPDEELAGHLSCALKYIIDTNFVAMFDAHKYALSEIEQLTPQALTILADYRNWPAIELGSYSSDGGRITTDWLSGFTNPYSSSKGITDRDTSARVRHSINELINRRIIEAELIGGDTNKAKCVITNVGSLLLPYIDKGV